MSDHPEAPPALRALLEGKNSELKRHHLAVRVGDYQGSRVSTIREILREWAPQEGAPLYAFWLQVKNATELYAEEIERIQGEMSGGISGIVPPGGPS
jgi:hypothetical protein